MSRTDAMFIGTASFAQTYGNTEPTNVANDVETKWNAQIDDSSQDYSITIDTDSPVHINETDTISEALSDVAGSMLVQTHLQSYDAVVVFDGRSYPNYDGMAYVDKAGTTLAVALVSGPLGKTALHELGHIYNASHDRFEQYGWIGHTVMHDSGVQSCFGNSPQLTKEFQVSSCTRNDIQSKINSI